MSRSRRIRSSGHDSYSGDQASQGSRVGGIHRIIFLLLIVVLVVAPVARGAAGFEVTGAMLCLVAAAAGLWVLSQYFGKEVHLVTSALSAPMLLLITYVILRYNLTEVELVARREVVMILGVAWLFFLVMNIVRHRWQLSWLVLSLVALGSVVALDGLWQFLRNSLEGEWQKEGGAVRATFANSVDFVVYLHLIFPVAAANFFFSRRSMTARILCAFGCVLMLVGMVTAGEWRYWFGWFASMLVLGVCVLQKRGWKFRWALVGTGVLATVAVSVWIAVTRMEVVAPHHQKVRVNVSEAVPLWRSAAVMTVHQPWMGVGPGMFRWCYPSYRGAQGEVIDAGNEYATFMAEYGLIGLALVVWIVLGFVIGAFFILQTRIHRYSASTTSNRYAFAVGGLAAGMAALVDAGLGCGFHAGGNLLTMIVLMGATLTCGLHNRSEEKLHEHGRYTLLQFRGVHRALLMGGSILMLALLGWYLKRTYPADFFIWRARQAGMKAEWATVERLYQKAQRFDSRNFEVMVGLADVSVAQVAINPGEANQLYGQAIRWYEEVLNKYNPRAYELWVKLGRVHDAMGNRVEALKSFDQAIQNDGRNAAYHYALAQHHERWGDVELAQKSFQRAFGLDPFAYRHLVPKTSSPPPADDFDDS